MKAKFINETMGDVLKPKSEKEIEDNWDKKFKYSYKTFKDVKANLEHIGVKVNKISSITGTFDISGFAVHKGNWVVMTTLLKEDAEKLIKTMETMDPSRYTEYGIKPDAVLLDFEDARMFLSRRLYKIKDYPEKGEYKRW